MYDVDLEHRGKRRFLVGVQGDFETGRGLTDGRKLKVASQRRCIKSASRDHFCAGKKKTGEFGTSKAHRVEQCSRKGKKREEKVSPIRKKAANGRKKLTTYHLRGTKERGCRWESEKRERADFARKQKPLWPTQKK